MKIATRLLWLAYWASKVDPNYKYAVIQEEKGDDGYWYVEAKLPYYDKVIAHKSGKLISAVKWILDHTVGWLIKLLEKMFGTGDFDAENTVKSTSNQYMSTDNSKTTNNVTINTSGDVDIDSINAALGGAY